MAITKTKLAIILSALGLCGCSLRPIDDYFSGHGDAGRDGSKPPECATGAKACGAACVSVHDPTFGCSPTGCAPCALPHVSVEDCSTDGKCILVECDAGFADCNNDPADGCEIDTNHDLKNCGGCNGVCQANLDCVNGLCCIAITGTCGGGTPCCAPLDCQLFQCK